MDNLCPKRKLSLTTCHNREQYFSFCLIVLIFGRWHLNTDRKCCLSFTHSVDRKIHQNCESKPAQLFLVWNSTNCFCFDFFSVSLSCCVPAHLVPNTRIGLRQLNRSSATGSRRAHTYTRTLLAIHIWMATFCLLRGIHVVVSSLFVRFRWWSMSGYLLSFDCHSLTLLVRFINKYDTNKIIHYYYLARQGDMHTCSVYLFKKKLLSSWRLAMSIVFNSSLPSAIRASRIISMFFYFHEVLAWVITAALTLKKIHSFATTNSKICWAITTQ